MDLVGWKGKASIRAYVPKNERIHYLRLLGGDTSKFEKNKYAEKRSAAENEINEPFDTKSTKTNSSKNEHEDVKVDNIMEADQEA